MAEFTKEDLREFQAEPLPNKIQRTLAKVSEWFSYWEGEVYVSFSGGKDSTVLADICARWCKIIGKTLYLVFVNTGLEYPEIQKHVKFFAEWLREKYGITVELEILRPEMAFPEVLKNYGYPIISKHVANKVRLARANIEEGVYSLRLRQLGIAKDEYGGLRDAGKWDYDATAEGSKFETPKYRALLPMDILISEECCNVMKKDPLKKYEKETGRYPIVGTIAEESATREAAWLKNGCNAFEAKRKTSQPLSFWTNQDILLYIKEQELPIPSVYGTIVYANEPEQIRWGEIDPDFAELESKEQQRLTTTGCDRTGCIFCAFGCHLEKEPSRFQRLKETHPRQYAYCIGGGEYDENGIWKPNKDGLGMGHVFDELNKIYGEGFIKY